MWQDIFTAFALYLIIEGMIPFVNPRKAFGGPFHRSPSSVTIICA